MATTNHVCPFQRTSHKGHQRKVFKSSRLDLSAASEQTFVIWCQMRTMELHVYKNYFFAYTFSVSYTFSKEYIIDRASHPILLIEINSIVYRREGSQHFAFR